MVSFRGFRMCSLREYAKCIEISAKTPEFLPVYMPAAETELENFIAQINESN